MKSKTARITKARIENTKGLNQAIITTYKQEMERRKAVNEYRSRQNLLIGRKNKKTYQLAQKVNVRVLKVDVLKNQIDLELVKNDDVERRFNSYPHELSGGQRQRIMIAMALVNKPQLLIADEPTTALDVTIQAQVINLMKDIIKEFNMGVIFITHDLGVIAQVADDVAVMYLGSVVEQGPVNEILKNPMHPYTRGLINALPDINNLDAPLTPIPGNIPSPLDRPNGCVFRTRCPHASKEGKEGNIKMGLVEVKPGHWLDKCGVECGKT